MRRGFALCFTPGIFRLDRTPSGCYYWNEERKCCRVNGQGPSCKFIEVIAELLTGARRLLLFWMIADHIDQHDNLDTESAKCNELRRSQVHVTTPSVRLRENRKKPPRVAREMLGREGLTAYRVFAMAALNSELYRNHVHLSNFLCMCQVFVGKFLPPDQRQPSWIWTYMRFCLGRSDKLTKFKTEYWQYYALFLSV